MITNIAMILLLMAIVFILFKIAMTIDDVYEQEDK